MRNSKVLAKAGNFGFRVSQPEPEKLQSKFIFYGWNSYRVAKSGLILPRVLLTMDTGRVKQYRNKMWAGRGLSY